ncbi:hypothetical protein E2C01_027809 [Portunus trituberculatus]|uniref:Uncharacterized protein n=1 Tax=Portunus trituberculatus TaxID=210409 RepID=A0A5B7EIU6_PORTR|nr:hypothetical protein [Portunus trituberculatus]
MRLYTNTLQTGMTLTHVLQQRRGVRLTHIHGYSTAVSVVTVIHMSRTAALHLIPRLCFWCVPHCFILVLRSTSQLNHTTSNNACCTLVIRGYSKSAPSEVPSCFIGGTSPHIVVRRESIPASNTQLVQNNLQHLETER